MNALPVCLVAILIFCLPGGILAETTREVRHYRPLLAKSVRIQAVSAANPEINARAIELAREGWTHFDSGRMEEAADRFLSALEASPGSVPAVEGLVMSLYRYGDYLSAVRIGEELSRAMPRIKSILADAAFAEVRALVGRSELAAARELLQYFPDSDRAYLPAHGLLGAALAMEAEGEGFSEPAAATLAGK